MILRESSIIKFFFFEQLFTELIFHFTVEASEIVYYFFFCRVHERVPMIDSRYCLRTAKIIV